MIFIFIISAYALNNTQLEPVFMKIQTTSYSLDNHQKLNLFYNFFNTGYSFALLNVNQQNQINYSPVIHQDSWPQLQNQLDGCYIIQNNVNVYNHQNISDKYSLNNETILQYGKINPTLIFVISYQQNQLTLRTYCPFNPTKENVNMTKVGIIIEMLISMSLKDIKCAFSFLNKIFIVLDSHIFVKLSNDTTPFSILPGFFNSTGNIDKAYFDNFLLSVHRIENPTIIEIYSIGQDSVDSHLDVETNLKEINDFKISHSQLIVCDQSEGILFYEIVSAAIINQIRIEGCKQIKVQDQSVIGIFTSKSKSDFVIEFFVDFVNKKFVVNSIYNQDSQINSINPHNSIGIILEQEQIVFTKLQLPSQLTNTEEMKILDILYFQNVIGIMIFASEEDPFGTKYKMMYFQQKGIGYIDFFVYSPQISCLMKESGTFNFIFQLNSTKCPLNKLNDYESLFKFCEVVHNFTLNVEQVYAKFSNWGTLGVAIICIVFVVLMIFIGLICLNKRWKSILLFLEWKNDRLKKAFEFETLKEKSLESNQQRIDNQIVEIQKE